MSVRVEEYKGERFWRDEDHEKQIDVGFGFCGDYGIGSGMLLEV
jgi:hypothetical protein